MVRIILISTFFHRHPTHKLCFLFSRPFVVNTKFSTGLVVPSVSWLGQLTVNRSQETEGTTGRVENFVLTTKGLQERKQLVSGTTVKKKVVKLNNSILKNIMFLHRWEDFS